MSMLIWGIAAVVAGVAVTATGVGMSSRARAEPPLPESLPPTPLQRLAQWGLLAGLVLLAAVVAVVLYFGPERTIEERAVRMAFTALLLTIVLVFALLSLRLRAWLRRGDGMVDERDRAILSGSSGLQSGAVLTTLVVWVIGLTESFHAVGAVPLYYLNLVFWSCLVVNLLALPLGVLLGYRRS